jgi:predicted Rossmann fold nucleotide-binding protein DprA/Smf involved in DNA uptake
VATDVQDAATPDDPALARTLTAIGHAPVLPDVLADHLGLPPGEVSAHLVMLELAGLLERRSDGRVVRAALAG